MLFEPTKNTPLQRTGTASIESYAKNDAGMAFYIITVNGSVKTFVYELRWDVIDYMAVARQVNFPFPDRRFNYSAGIETMWSLGRPLNLARRGNDYLNWDSHGVVQGIVFSEALNGYYAPAAVDRLIALATR